MEDWVTPTTLKAKYFRLRPDGGACLRLPYEPSGDELAVALAEAEALGYRMIWEDENFESIVDGMIEYDLYRNDKETQDGIADAR